MAHFAKIDENNFVTEVIVVDNQILLGDDNQEIESLGREFCENLFGGTWIQTSFNENFRGRFAGIGMKYDAKTDKFLDLISE